MVREGVKLRRGVPSVQGRPLAPLCSYPGARTGEATHPSLYSRRETWSNRASTDLAANVTHSPRPSRTIKRGMAWEDTSHLNVLSIPEAHTD